MRTRHRLSREAAEMVEEMSQVIADGKETIKMDKIAEGRSTLPVEFPPSDRGYEALNSRSSMLADIIQAFKDPKIRKIGLYGMSGVGKSTLVKQLAWQVEQHGSFGKVLVATVSISPDVKKIQGQLADGLGLKFNDETEDGRARRLYDRMTKVNNILVILDDIWKMLDLAKIGVPSGDDHERCKLLLISRDLNVLECHMGTHKDFKLEVLTASECWILFKKTAGDVVEDHNIKPTAEKVAHSCDGLPLSIVTVATTLKNKKNLPSWKDALDRLTRRDHPGVKSRVYPAIELSYHHLESDELKSFFLFLASFPNGISKKDLLRYSWGSGLFKDANTLADARNRLYTLTTDLEASCLLLEEERDWVRMHDVVHEVASSIASKVQPFFTKPRHAELIKWPNSDIPQHCHSIFLVCYFHELPQSLECPKLKLLCLNNEDNFLKVPDEFFVGTRQLEVLDLGGFNCFPYPPSSLLHLTNLRALYLCKSVLEDISIVAKLTNLEILSLDRSEIKELPIELAQLTSLRVLDLRSCSGLTVIPANLISSLTCMEELYMGNCFIQWEAEGSKSNNASLGELKRLHHLKTLDLQVQHASVLPRDLLVFGQLERYNISINCGWKWWSLLRVRPRENSRGLLLDAGMEANIHLNRGVKLLLNSVEELYLAKLKGFKNVLYQFAQEGFPQLKHLHIHNSDEIQYIIDLTEWVSLSRAFPCLESLGLHNLTNIHGPLPAQLFTKLKVLKVKGCNRVEYLFLHSIVSKLFQLVEVEISECNSVTSIILNEGGDDNNKMEELNFPKLCSLTLDCLPRLVSFSYKPLPSDVKSRTDDAEYADGLNIPVVLFNKKIAFPKLESLKISSINTRKIWNDQLSTHSCIQNLISLTIDGCRRIEYLFPSSVARGLVNLQHLEITRCQWLKVIFDLPSRTHPISSNEVSFPSLQTLIISHMGSLESIWNDELTPDSFCKLINMEISYCKTLPYLFQFHELNNLHHLERLLITNCDALEFVFEIQGQDIGDVSQHMLATQLKTLTLEHLPMLRHIWSKDPHGTINFQNLCTVKVTECESLNHVFPVSVAAQLLQLQELEILDSGVENIVAEDEREVTAPRFVFPQLTSLKFWRLLKLKSFYPTIHTLDCPKLTKLEVWRCDKMQVFNFKPQYYLEDNVLIDRQPLLSFEKVICNAEELFLSSKDIMAICNDDCGNIDFSTVPSLYLDRFDASDQVPWAFLQRFTRLENLTLRNGFLFQSLPSKEIETIIKLKSLRLEWVWTAENLFEENSQIQSVLPNLEYLVVKGCNRLKSIVRSCVQFQNLDILELDSCSGLINIARLSTATSFMKLTDLRICNCERIEEIVAGEEDDASEVTFPILKKLQLVCLRRLGSFSKGNHSFRFPLLEVMFVIECPMMETFSHASLSTPYLRAVHVTEKGDEWLWEGDLNATIKNLFNKTRLDIFSINSRIIGIDQLSTLSHIQNLKRLTIDDCGSLEYLFPFSVAIELVNLQYLKITRCGMLREMFDQGGNFPSTSSAISSKETIFTRLETLVISHLDSLTSVWNNQLAPNSFCKLVNMEVSFCQKLSNVFPYYVLNILRCLDTLLVTDCAALELMFDIQEQNTRDVTQLKALTLERLPVLKHIWNKDPYGSISFQNLCTVTISECESLTHVFPLSVAKQLLQLQLLDIRNCGIKNIIAKDDTNTSAARLVFPQLTLLRFWKLSELESFYSGIHTLDCPELRELDVYHCDKLQVFKSQNYPELTKQPLFSFEKAICNVEKLSLSGESIRPICNDDCGDVDFSTVSSLELQCFHDESDQVPWAFLQRFTNLEYLILGCSSFVQISPGIEIETLTKLKSLSLHNLWKLENICQENSQILQCFMQLRYLSISDCKMIEEIVVNKGEEAGEVAFMKLERLELINLPRLRSFSKGNHSFKFPLLKLMRVIECPMLETLCHASLSTPSLTAIHVTRKGDESHWDGDLNATIKKLFNDTVQLQANENATEDGPSTSTIDA